MGKVFPMRDHTQEPFDLNVGVEVEENENAYEASHMLCLGGAQRECVDGGGTEHEIPLQIDLNKAPLDEDETHLIDLNESPMDGSSQMDDLVFLPAPRSLPQSNQEGLDEHELLPLLS